MQAAALALMSISPAPAGGGSASPDPVSGLLASQGTGRAGKTDNSPQDDSTDDATAGSSFAQMLAGALGQSSTASPPAQQTPSTPSAGGAGGDEAILANAVGSAGSAPNTAAIDTSALANDTVGQVVTDPTVAAAPAAADPSSLITAPVSSPAMQPTASATDQAAALNLLDQVAQAAAPTTGAAASADKGAGAKLANNVLSIVGKAASDVSATSPSAPVAPPTTPEPQPAATDAVATAASTPSVQTPASAAPSAPLPPTTTPTAPTLANAAPDATKTPAVAPPQPAPPPPPPPQASGAATAAAIQGDPVAHAGFGVAVQALGASKPGVVKTPSAIASPATSPTAVQPSVTKDALTAAAVPAPQPVSGERPDTPTNGDERAAAQPGQDPSSQPSASTTAAASAATFQPTQQVASTTVSHTVARLSADIVKNVQAKSSRFEVGLDPAGLGRVNVKVHIGANGALTASLSFDNAQSAEALKARSGELRSALEQAGFSLEGSSLSFTSGDAGRQANGGPGGRFKAGAAFAATAAAAEPDFAAIQAGQTASGGLDVRI